MPFQVTDIVNNQNTNLWAHKFKSMTVELVIGFKRCANRFYRNSERWVQNRKIQNWGWGYHLRCNSPLDNLNGTSGERPKYRYYHLNIEHIRILEKASSWNIQRFMFLSSVYLVFSPKIWDEQEMENWSDFYYLV